MPEPSLSPLLGIKCDSYQHFTSGLCCHQDSQFAELGERCSIEARGVFYLNTGPPPGQVLPVNKATNCILAQQSLSTSHS